MKNVSMIDQGTMSTWAILFDEGLSPVVSVQEEFPQIFPKSGWVEHDPEDLWSTPAETCRAVIKHVDQEFANERALERHFRPAMGAETRIQKCANSRRAVAATSSF